MGIVNNQCPECNKGSIDQNINGDGRWNVEWFAVPCNVGDGKIKYSRISNLGPEYWALVVSNTRVPVKDVQIKVDGKERREFFFPLSARRSAASPFSSNLSSPSSSFLPCALFLFSLSGCLLLLVVDRDGDDGRAAPDHADGRVAPLELAVAHLFFFFFRVFFRFFFLLS